MTYIGSWADLKYTIPAEHKLAEGELAVERITGFNDPVQRRPAEFRNLHGNPDAHDRFDWMSA